MPAVKQVQWSFFRYYSQGNFAIAADKLAVIVNIMFPETVPTVSRVAITNRLERWLQESSNKAGKMKESAQYTFHNGLTIYFIDSKYPWVTGLGNRRCYSLTVNPEHSTGYDDHGFTRWFVDNVVVHHYTVVPSVLATRGTMGKRMSAHVPWHVGKLSDRHHPHIVKSREKKQAIAGASMFLLGILWGGFFYMLAVIGLLLVLHWAYVWYRYKRL